MVEKDLSTTHSRTRKRWRNRPTQWMPDRSSESQPSRADARSNCQLPYLPTDRPHFFPRKMGPQYHANFLRTLRTNFSNFNVSSLLNKRSTNMTSHCWETRTKPRLLLESTKCVPGSFTISTRPSKYSGKLAQFLVISSL